MKFQYRRVGVIHFVLCSLLLFSSCAHKNYSKEMLSASTDIRLHIEMPQNKVVFENLSVMVYDALWNHFNRVGYRLEKKKATGNDSRGCSLKVAIQDVGSSYKFLSPDLLTYATRIRVVLSCQLFDEDNVLIKHKTFVCSSMIPRAKDYVENSNFSDFEYKRLFERYAPKIDYYFRQFLLKKMADGLNPPVVRKVSS